MKINYKNVGSNLKALRKSEGMTLCDVGDIAFPDGLYDDPSNVISRIESGALHSLKALVHLANFFWVPLEGLISDDFESLRCCAYTNGQRNVKKISINLCAVMTEKGITREELAVKSRITISSIQSYRTGRRIPSLDQLLSISKALEIPVDRLVE